MSTINDLQKLLEGIVDSNLVLACGNSIKFNDTAHDLDHVYTVCSEGLTLLKRFNKVDEKEFVRVVMHACLMHDLGCRYNRDDHHLISYGLVYQFIEKYSSPAEYFSPKTMLAIATCVLEHRSSNPNQPTSLPSQIVRLADMGKPDFFEYLKRAYKFRIDGLSNEKFDTMDELLSLCKKHMLDKFEKVNGYNWKSYPSIGLELYKEEWKEFDTILNSELRFNKVFDKVIR